MIKFLNIGIEVARAQKILPGGEPENWSLNTISELMNNVQNLALAIGGGIAVLCIILGAIYYLTAYGNEEKANKGKNIIMWALIGIILIALAAVLVNTFVDLLK